MATEEKMATGVSGIPAMKVAKNHQQQLFLRRGDPLADRRCRACSSQLWEAEVREREGCYEQRKVQPIARVTERVEAGLGPGWGWRRG